MAASVVVEQSSVSVVPGQTATCTIRIRNTEAVVDQFTLTVLGQPAAWTTVVPAALSLFPNADGTIELHFAPPRAPGVGSGATPFGVRVVGSQDPDNPVVEEGEVDLLPFVEVTGKLTPRTAEAKRTSKHEVILDNKGNTSVAVTLSVTDPDEQLAFGLSESLVTVEAGQSTHVPLKVAVKNGFARGAEKHRPFQVTALPEGNPYPLVMEGNLIQKPGMPRFVLPLVAGVVAIGVIAALLPALKKDAKGNLQLTGNEATTTTVAAAPEVEEEEPDPNAPATPEEAQAAAAAELAANGKDPNAPAAGGSGGGGDDGTSAAGGGGTPAGGGPASSGGNTGGDESPAVTSPSATTAAPPPPPAPSGGGGGGTAATTTTTSTSTTQPPTTTTTVPSRTGTVRGTWSFDMESGYESSTTTADFWWEIYDGATRWITPRNGATFSNMGMIDYEAVTQAKLQSLAYSATKIVGSDAGNAMPPGTVLAVKTNAGRYAKMKILGRAADNTLTFRFYTYP